MTTMTNFQQLVYNVLQMKFFSHFYRKDPISESFKFLQICRMNSFILKAHSHKVKVITRQLKDFSTVMLDLCRGSENVSRTFCRELKVRNCSDMDWLPNEMFQTTFDIYLVGMMTKPLGLIKVIFNLLTLLVASVAPKVVLPFGILSEIGLEFIYFLTKGS